VGGVVFFYRTGRIPDENRIQIGKNDLGPRKSSSHLVKDSDFSIPLPFFSQHQTILANLIFRLYFSDYSDIPIFSATVQWFVPEVNSWKASFRQGVFK
jgi:hypothetical protein